MKAANIPLASLQDALQRISNGSERWEDVAASLGVGVTALRGCLRRAGLPYEFGRRPRANKNGVSRGRKATTQSGRVWDQDFSNRMLRVPL